MNSRENRVLIKGMANSFFTLADDDETPNLPFSCPQSADNINDFLFSHEGKKFKTGIENIIREIKTWVQINWLNGKDQEIKNEILKGFDGFLKTNIYAHPVFASNNAAEAAYNKQQTNLYMFGIRLLYSIKENLKSDKVPLDTRKEIIRVLAPNLFTCGDGYYTYIEIASTLLSSQVSTILMSYKKTLAEQFTQEALRKENIQNTLKDQINNSRNLYDITFPGFNVHNVTAITNQLAEEFGFKKIADTHSRPIEDYVGLQMCLREVQVKMRNAFTAESVVDYLLFQQPVPLLQQVESILENITHDNRADKEAQLKRALDKYGVDPVTLKLGDTHLVDQFLLPSVILEIQNSF